MIAKHKSTVTHKDRSTKPRRNLRERFKLGSFDICEIKVLRNFLISTSTSINAALPEKISTAVIWNLIFFFHFNAFNDANYASTLFVWYGLDHCNEHIKHFSWLKLAGTVSVEPDYFSRALFTLQLSFVPRKTITSLFWLSVICKFTKVSSCISTISDQRYNLLYSEPKHILSKRN